ncbi:unnamed protein product [Soboliphyme baturini]|uniref:Transmembrane protein n=1 Tax=Soboliphyme baturini TaxID=241478 RepID=A0A183J6Q2_9BILA|nr:unnamed protein product [Soboliphyme baturini]
MAGLPSGSSNAMAIYVGSFAICGLVLLTMCAHAAVVQLKWTFVKFHYFGRKIKWRKRPIKGIPQLDEEVIEVMRLISEVRREILARATVNEAEILDVSSPTPESPRQRKNPQRLATLARWALKKDTLAFMPGLLDMLKFADETDERETVL